MLNEKNIWESKAEERKKKVFYYKRTENDELEISVTGMNAVPWMHEQQNELVTKDEIIGKQDEIINMQKSEL